jgi:hypothetical protein
MTSYIQIQLKQWRTEGVVWGVQTPPKFRNFDKVPKIKKILLYEIKFLVPYYSCLQNPWLGGQCPQIPVLSVLNWICWTPTEQNSWVRHWAKVILNIVTGCSWVVSLQTRPLYPQLQGPPLREPWSQSLPRSTHQTTIPFLSHYTKLMLRVSFYMTARRGISLT